jgi:hypothetical protein
VRFFAAMWSLAAPHDQASILSVGPKGDNPLPKE